MTHVDHPQFIAAIAQLADALGARPPTQAGMVVWIQTLKEFPFNELRDQLDAWAKRSNKMPTPHDLWKACNEQRTDRLEQTAKVEKVAFRLDAERTFKRSDRVGRALHALSEELRNAPPRDPKEWAHVLWERFIADRPNPSGEPMSQIQIQFACEALRRPLKDAYAAREQRRQGLAA